MLESGNRCRMEKGTNSNSRTSPWKRGNESWKLKKLNSIAHLWITFIPAFILSPDFSIVSTSESQEGYLEGLTFAPDIFNSFFSLDHRRNLKPIHYEGAQKTFELDCSEMMMNRGESQTGEEGRCIIQWKPSGHFPDWGTKSLKWIKIGCRKMFFPTFNHPTASASPTCWTLQSLS